MRIVRGLAAAILGVSLLAAPAVAQMRMGGPPIIILPPGAKPRVMPPPGGPSGAVANAMRNYPNARPLGVIRNGNNFVVKIKKGNQVILVPGY